MMDYYGQMTQPQRLVPLVLAAAIWGVCPLPALSQATQPANSELSATLFYNILVGELSAQSGDLASAYSLMLDAARTTRSPALYERTVNIALRARAGDSALQAAQAWSTAHPTSADAARYELQILLGLNRLVNVAAPAKRLLAAVPADEKVATINLLGRLIGRASDKQLAVTVAAQALSGELNQPATAGAAWAGVGALRLAAGNSEGALAAAKAGAARTPSAPEPVLLALSLMDAKSPGAEALVLAYLQTRQVGSDVRMGYARRLLEAQRYADASTQLEILTNEAPTYPEGWLLRGSLEFQSKKLDDAQASLQRYTTLATSNGQARGRAQAAVLLSQIAESKGDLEEALRVLDAVPATQDPARLQNRRAALLAKQGKLDQARALIRAIPEREPQDAREKINAEVQLLRQAKQYQAVYDTLQSALAASPQDPDLLYELATAAEKLGRPDEMERLLRQLIASHPTYHNAYNALGYSLADRNLRLPEARQLIQKALEYAPNEPYIVDSLGWVEFRSGNLTEALRLLQEAFRNQPDAEIAAHLGEVLWVMGRTEQAQAVWKQGLELNPANEVLRETMERLRRP
ncbi:tetratricopeptide repeat protein [Rhodoferax sp.]|jgi:tetratricopeptide (TPR) repeat protein|uniref:tetratricopeptide repeat protein n=1 Tax=Rhodoferax sp. TaxID=50421 RepID=UPI0037848F41